MEKIKVDSIPRGVVRDTPALTHCMLNSFKEIYKYIYLYFMSFLAIKMPKIDDTFIVKNSDSFIPHD